MNVIIVHGCPSDVEKAMDPQRRTYDKHWIIWLKNELEKINIKVDAPLMPVPWEPKYSEWKEKFDLLKINEETVLIGHSCGGAFLVRWLYETKREIKKLILISPGKSKNTKKFSNLYGEEVYKNVQDYVKDQIIIFTAEDDLDYHIKSAYEYEEELPAKVIKFGKGYGHFREKDMGTKEFPELLEEVLK